MVSMIVEAAKRKRRAVHERGGNPNQISFMFSSGLIDEALIDDLVRLYKSDPIRSKAVEEQITKQS